MSAYERHLGCDKIKLRNLFQKSSALFHREGILLEDHVRLRSLSLVTWVYVRCFIQLQMNKAGKAALGKFLYLSNLGTAKVILKEVRR